MISAIPRNPSEFCREATPPISPQANSRTLEVAKKPVLPPVDVHARGDAGTGDRRTRFTSMVGYSNLPNQVYQKAVARGFTFNLMVTGSPGLGKSSFINSLFCTDIYNVENPSASRRASSSAGTRVEARRFLLNENRVKMRLTVVDTPGFGQGVNNSNCWQPIVSFLETRFEEYLRAELNVVRTTVGSGATFMANLPKDDRVHACLYFVAPTGHGLHQLDIETMKSLHEKVNLIVVIGKADTFTPEECMQFKRTISRELSAHGIHVYDFPESVVSMASEGSTDEKRVADVRAWQKRQPFAVVCSDQLIQEANGRKIRGRVYPWGIVETENLAHNDFVALKTLLFNVHLHDLLHVTHIQHYANYYSTRLRSIAEASKFPVEPEGREPLSQLEAERLDRQRQLMKLETDMETVFEQKVHERTQKLHENGRELEQRITQLTQQLANEAAEFERQRRTFDDERALWESDNRDALELLQQSLDKISLKGRSKRKGFL